MIQKMTCAEYADLTGLTRQGVAKAAREGRLLKGIISYEIVGRQHVLTVDTKKAKKK